jgi:hypothetical protein
MQTPSHADAGGRDIVLDAAAGLPHEPLPTKDESMLTPSRSQQSILIDAVFHNREKYLLEAFRERLDQLERRQQLAHVSGIRDEAVLDRLLGVGIT